MKKFLTLFVTLFMGMSLVFFSCNEKDPNDPNNNNNNNNDQEYVSKDVQNKKAVIEEFTGVKCGYCPDGHLKAAEILTANPGNAIVVAYHPQSGSFNTPYAGDEDLRRTWPDPLWAITFSGKQAMPGAFINRRMYGGLRWCGRSTWAGHADEIMSEVSPLNVGFTSVYDATTKILTVKAQVYYTADMNDENTLYCVLIEDGVITQQSGNPDPPDYEHKHVFREGLSDFLGDPIVQTTVTGTMVNKEWTFDNSSTNYNMAKCHVVVFVRNANANSNEIISGNIAAVNASTPL
jgi:hypothetical protein